MRSELIEYFRYGDLETGMLRRDDKFIRSHGSKPVVEVSTPFNQLQLLRELSEHFRYDQQEEDQQRTIASISNELKDFFIALEELSVDPGELIQIDMVLNASEMGLIPFELFCDQAGRPYFAHEDYNFVLTRRIRGNYNEKTIGWPVIPRILFVTANPGYPETVFQEIVPDDFLGSFNFILEQLGGSTEDSRYFKHLKDPTFEDFQREIYEAIESGQRYTHVHIVAHGYRVIDEAFPYNSEYGVAFPSANNQPTKAEKFKTLFGGISKDSLPIVVNYLICDGANFSNALIADKNPVQVTHREGVPVVIGSQFPLSMNGARRFTELFYKELFSGLDVREILGKIRRDLYNSSSKLYNHDWISLVSYVSLPEGYLDYLDKFKLEKELINLKAVRKQTEDIEDAARVKRDNYIDHYYRLERSINTLQQFFSDYGENKAHLKLENAGLLGSAYKRQAELKFLESRRIDSNPRQSLDVQREKLRLAMDWYKLAAEKNLSHHWSVTQFLSLETVLQGAIQDEGYWQAARLGAEKEYKLGLDNAELISQKQLYWALGTLIELRLLKGVSGTEKEEILVLVSQFVEWAQQSQANFAIQSTYLQLKRYTDWWTAENGFSINPDYGVRNWDLMGDIFRSLKT